MFVGSDPLRNIDPIQEELDALPYLGRCNYAKNSSLIVSMFDPRAQAYQVAIYLKQLLHQLYH